MTQLDSTTRRERQREATYAEIVAASRDLLADGAELSLRAVATRIGMTAPALYRYVGSHQELVDLVAYEIDRAATDRFREAAEAAGPDDAAGRLMLSVTEFRRWALRNPHEFGLVFANPLADPIEALGRAKREMLTLSCSGHLFTDLLYRLWERAPYPYPALDELPAPVRESVLDPLIPAKVEHLAPDQRGLVWIYMQGWTRLYGVVALEVFGHMDPRVIESGEMFLDTLRDFAPRLGLTDDLPRLEAMVRARLGRD